MPRVAATGTVSARIGTAAVEVVVAVEDAIATGGGTGIASGTAAAGGTIAAMMAADATATSSTTGAVVTGAVATGVAVTGTTSSLRRTAAAGAPHRRPRSASPPPTFPTSSPSCSASAA